MSARSNARDDRSLERMAASIARRRRSGLSEREYERLIYRALSSAWSRGFDAGFESGSFSETAGRRR